MKNKGKINSLLKIITLLLMVPALTINAQNMELKLASDVWPPFTNVETEEALAFKLIEKAFDRLQIEPEFVINDFSAVLSGIKKGEYQGSSALWKNKEREEFMYFSDAYLSNQLILLGRKGSNVNIKSFSELSGKKIGLVEGYAYGDSLLSVPNLEVYYNKSDQENLEYLLSEEVHYILVDAILIQYMLKYQINDVSRLLEFSDKPLIVRSLHVALNKTTPNAQSTIEALNKELKLMLSDGSYNEILQMEWIRADVDGDGELELVFTGEKAGTKEPSLAYDVHSAANNGEQTAYYMNGVRYESWEDVPEKYKIELPEKIQYIPVDNFGVILKF